jgi:hypothetical protein
VKDADIGARMLLLDVLLEGRLVVESHAGHVILLAGWVGTEEGPLGRIVWRGRQSPRGRGGY